MAKYILKAFFLTTFPSTQKKCPKIYAVTLVLPLKDRCYSENPTTTEELMKAIRKTVNTISDKILSKVFYSFGKRIDCCSSGDGEHFENIYH